MVQKKKKTKTSAKKAISPAKKKTRSIAKKAAKSPAKKKATTTARKKTKNLLGEKMVRAVSKITKALVSRKAGSRTKKIERAPKEASIPEIMKQDELMPPKPAHEETPAEIVEEHKQSEHRFENREDVAMNQENQRAKSAMSTRQKRVYRNQPHK